MTSCAENLSGSKCRRGFIHFMSHFKKYGQVVRKGVKVGFEPTTSGVSTRRSNQLSYSSDWVGDNLSSSARAGDPSGFEPDPSVCKTEITVLRAARSEIGQVGEERK